MSQLPRRNVLCRGLYFSRQLLLSYSLANSCPDGDADVDASSHSRAVVHANCILRARNVPDSWNKRLPPVRRREVHCQRGASLGYKLLVVLPGVLCTGPQVFELHCVPRGQAK